MHLEKNRTHACTFPVQRKEINVVKVRFTMRYSSRKLSHEKVITTACNFWRQIACSFLVKSGNVLLLGKNVFKIPPFFQTRPDDLGKKAHACSLRFSALNVNATIWTRATLVGGECSHHCAITCSPMSTSKGSLCIFYIYFFNSMSLFLTGYLTSCCIGVYLFVKRT